MIHKLFKRCRLGLNARRAMPYWEACQMEGTSWFGTAAEGVEDHRPL